MECIDRSGNFDDSTTRENLTAKPKIPNVARGLGRAIRSACCG